MSNQIRAVAVVDKATSRIVYYQELGPKFSGFPVFHALHDKVACKMIVPDTMPNTVAFSPSTCYQFKLDASTGVVTPVATDVDAVMMDLILWNRKYETYEVLVEKIVHLRKSGASNHIFGQEAVYARKENQARNFRINGYKNPINFPMVQDAAEIQGITPKAAADSILQKVRAHVAVLRNTERNRMVYKKAIFRAQSSDELAQVVDNINNF